MSHSQAEAIRRVRTAVGNGCIRWRLSWRNYKRRERLLNFREDTMLQRLLLVYGAAGE